MWRQAYSPATGLTSPETEREIVSQYSYGRQLGRVIDVLSELIERWPGGVPDDRAVQRFAELTEDIGKIKAQGIVRAISELAELKQSNPPEYARLAPKLRQILEPGPISHAEQPPRQGPRAPIPLGALNWVGYRLVAIRCGRGRR